MTTLARCSLPIALVATLGGLAVAAPRPAPSPCVNPGVRDGARRTLHDASATAAALTYCTGADCWSLDLASLAFSSIAAIKPVAAPAADTPGKSADGRATATPTEVAFCPSGPTSCKRFSYKFAFPPQNGLSPMINAQGTLGAVVYAGVGEESQPRILLTYDLVAGKLIKQVELKANAVEVFRTSFLFDNALYAADKLKKLGKLANAKADLQPIAGTDLIALADPEHTTVTLQDTATGKAFPAIKLPGAVGIDQVVPATDGARLFVITQATSEGEVYVIDLAKHKLAARLTPPRCDDGTARAK